MPPDYSFDQANPALLAGALSEADDPERDFFNSIGPTRILEPEPEPEPAEELEATIAKLEAAEAAPPSSDATELVSSCPAQSRHALEATVHDTHDNPLENVVVELRKSDTEALQTKSDADGRARFEGLEAGSYQLGLPQIDQDAWELVSSEPLPSGRDVSRSPARWTVPPAASTSPVTHPVEQGECMSTIAHRTGWLADMLWDAKDNVALKELRGNKNILNPGDEVVIPPVRARFETVQPSKHYVVRRKGAVEEIRIRFLDDKEQPRKGEPYLVEIVSDAGTEVREDTTNPEGFVIEVAPPTTTKVTILLGKKPAQETHVFHAATLQPIDTVSGVQGRLLNLGYDCHEDEPGELGPRTKRALRDFQRDYALEVTCEIDDPTRDKILEVHLS